MTQQLKHSHAKRDAKHKQLAERSFEDPAGTLKVKEADAKDEPGLDPLPEPTYTPLSKRRKGDKVSLEDI
jgi:hypothetical protein